jgi:hypothetical protein
LIKHKPEKEGLGTQVSLWLLKLEDCCVTVT